MSHINSGGAGGGGGLLELNVKLINNTNSPYVVATNDTFIGVDTTAGVVTLLLPTNPSIGRSFIIKDVGGQAEVNNITITDISGADSYDNTFGNYVMNTELQGVNIIYTGSNNYYIW